MRIRERSTSPKVSLEKGEKVEKKRVLFPFRLVELFVLQLLLWGCSMMLNLELLLVVYFRAQNLPLQLLSERRLVVSCLVLLLEVSGTESFKFDQLGPLLNT